jgi:hypothetical protein
MVNKIKTPAYRGSYETRMIEELTSRLLELEGLFRDHLLDCEQGHDNTMTQGTDPAGAFRKRPKQDLPITRAACQSCADGVPHATSSDCDSARRDLAKRR